MHAIQELNRDRILLRWGWDNAHPIHNGEEGKLEAVDGIFVTCACNGRRAV